MIGLRIGVGSLGFLCLSAALVMVLEQIGALSGFGGELALVALAIGVGGASLWLIWQMAPDSISTSPSVAVPHVPQPVKAEQIKDDAAGAGISESVRLVPQLPGVNTAGNGSWLGGHPMMPQGMDWPEIDGKPGHFLAQINCASLPDQLWNRQGPRRGAMVFFRAEHPDSGTLPVHVMHVDGPLYDTALPEGVERRPHWPLNIQFGEDETKGLSAEPNWSALHDVDLTHAAFQPFDTISARLLRDHLRDVSDEGAEFQPEVLNRVLQALTEISGGTSATTGHASGFQERMNTLHEQETDLFSSINGFMSAHPRLAMSYFHAFERHCRCVYTTAPSALPDAQRAVFEPFWRHSAHHESGSIGQGVAAATAATGHKASGAELLLELPSSELLGWKFGKGRALRVYAPPEDVAIGRFSRAWGCVAV